MLTGRIDGEVEVGVGYRSRGGARPIVSGECVGCAQKSGGEGARAKVSSLDDVHVRLWRYVHGEHGHLLEVTQRRHHGHRRCTAEVVPLDFNLTGTLTIDHASRGGRIYGPRQILSVQGGGGGEDVVFQLVGAARVVVQGGWRSRQKRGKGQCVRGCAIGR